MDTWKATPKLTLTYGLRYELFAPIMDRTNNTSNFTPDNGGGVITAASNASGWADRALINPDKNDFAPRLGFAYQMTNRLVWRGGYGVFYQHSNRIGSESLIQINPPFLLDVQLNQSGANTVFQLQNGFPLDTITGSGIDLTSIQLRAQDPNQRSSYVEQTSFGLEYQVTSNTVLAATYVGNWGRKMNRLRDYNQAQVTGFDNGCPILQYRYVCWRGKCVSVHRPTRFPRVRQQRRQYGLQWSGTFVPQTNVQGSVVRSQLHVQSWPRQLRR
jgi:hypothetical protein